MEYLEGEALSVILNAEGVLLPQRFFDFALQLCAGLEAAHRAERTAEALKGTSDKLYPLAAR